MKTRQCTKCGRVLPLEDFYANTRGLNGKTSRCKHCIVEQQMRRRKNDPEWQVRHSDEVHEKKQRKRRVANGKGDRAEYMHKHYEANKERLKAKNRADYIRRTTDITVKQSPIGKQKPLKAERACLKCANYPCFQGIESFKTDFAACGCHGYKEREGYMINGFIPQTEPLTDYERNTLLPVIASGLRNKVGEAKAITNSAITSAMKGAGYRLTEARVRKIINHIRTTGMVKWLIATSKGYYIATSRQEMEDYIDSLRGREAAIRAVRESMERQLN